jgi:Na+/H+ antiporter NhaD/arsenite permease-like protein
VRADVPGVAVVPFVLLLLCIAIFPVIFPHFWEKNRNKALLCAALSLPVAGYLLGTAPSALGHAVHDYVAFLLLLAALYVIAGGVVLTGDLRATPAVNCAFLGAGALLANVIGTTGASMLLIRTVLRTNRERRHTRHVPIFFIFLVSNCGGLLTPLGDPPLFLGFLRGVPFAWTLRLWPIFALVNGSLLLVFYLWDRRAYAREAPADLAADTREIEPLSLRGSVNFVWLGGVVVAAFLPTPWRELALAASGVASLLTTPAGVRRGNGFTLGPIVEVAILFAGIFVTMVPALELLGSLGESAGIDRPWQFFWLTGALSSFLDNAPTYLTFLSLAQGLPGPHDVAGVSNELLAAVSAGAVLMGATTYIGNGPNFMVKSIAEEQGVPMPTFFGYMGYSAILLLPLFGICTIVFFL